MHRASRNLHRAFVTYGVLYLYSSQQWPNESVKLISHFGCKARYIPHWLSSSTAKSTQIRTFHNVVCKVLRCPNPQICNTEDIFGVVLMQLKPTHDQTILGFPVLAYMLLSIYGAVWFAWSSFWFPGKREVQNPHLRKATEVT